MAMKRCAEAQRDGLKSTHQTARATCPQDGQSYRFVIFDARHRPISTWASAPGTTRIGRRGKAQGLQMTALVCVRR
jgi:hypothetical protein